MLNIVVPNVVVEAFEIIIPIAKWDILEGLNFGSDKVSIGAADSQKIQFQQKMLGYTPHNLFANLGSLSIFWVIYLFKFLILLILKILR